MCDGRIPEAPWTPPLDPPLDTVVWFNCQRPYLRISPAYNSYASGMCLLKNVFQTDSYNVRVLHYNFKWGADRLHRKATNMHIPCGKAFFITTLRSRITDIEAQKCFSKKNCITSRCVVSSIIFVSKDHCSFVVNIWGENSTSMCFPKRTVLIS